MAGSGPGLVVFFFSFIHGSSQPLPGSPLDPGSCSFTEEPLKVTFRSCVLASASAHAFRRPLAGFLLTSARGNYHRVKKQMSPPPQGRPAPLPSQTPTSGDHASDFGHYALALPVPEPRSTESFLQSAACPLCFF